MIEPRTVMVLVKPKKVEEKTEGGILLTKQIVDREQKAVTIGEVLAIGPDAWYDVMDEGAKVGDIVAFAQYSGFAVLDDDGEEVLLMNDEDIKATVGRKEK